MLDERPQAAPTSLNGEKHTMSSPQVPLDDARRNKDQVVDGTPTKAEDKENSKNDKVTGSGKKANKRRKVNHACVYCRRSHMTCDLQRPCARCIKRDIGHLCHDEPREPAKRTKSEAEVAQVDSKVDSNGTGPDTRARDDSIPNFQPRDGGVVSAPPATLPGAMDAPPLAQPRPLSPAQQRLGNGNQNFANINQWDYNLQNQFSDMHHLHPYNTFNNSEVNNEYNLLGDFLSSSLLDDGMYSTEEGQGLFIDPLLSTNGMGNFSAVANLTPAQAAAHAQAGGEISRPSSTFPVDPKAREKYFLAAADPAGNDSPEERMNRLLKAKYDAGMLKPFNYVKGYARLNNYMEKHMRQVSKQKILRQLNQFRPKFREAMQGLTDIQLVKVEMWFERCLMEYDRVFASMAIPTCCWRRTGEIYRCNKEMAELIHMPMEKLRDGNIALHEIMVEDSLVSYWEKFGAIAFDQSQKAILTSCSLKNPDSSSKDPYLRCCFSFTIRRDTHNIPAIIVGNFLPIQPE